MEFAPVNSAGIYRSLRFVNALAENNIHPVVLTFEVDENLRKVQSHFDEKLLHLLHPGVKVVRVPLNDITKLTATKWGRIRYIMNNASGDNFYNGWKTEIFSVLDALIPELNPRLVITSCPPFSSAVLCRDIEKKYRLPYIIDMRDAWSEWGMVPQASYLHFLRKKLRERSVLRKATKIISVTPQLIRKFQSAHPSIPKDNYALIYNSPNFPVETGFSVQLKKVSEQEQINIGYTGSLYYHPKSKAKNLHEKFRYYPGAEDWFYRTPWFFLKSLAALLNKRREWKKKIFFHYIGNDGEMIRNQCKELGIETNAIIHGYLPQHKVKELEVSFDVLLTTSEKIPGAEHYCLPSKLFTYLLAKKPVFGFVTKGIQAEFLKELGVGILFAPDEVELNVVKLENLFEQGWEGKMNVEYFRQFNADATGSEFVRLVKETTNRLSAGTLTK